MAKTKEAAEIEVLDASDWQGKSALSRTASNLPALPTQRRIRLSNLNHVANELARVYRGMRSGEIPPENGSRYSYVLQTLAKVLEAAEFEKRIAALEKKQ